MINLRRAKIQTSPRPKTLLRKILQPKNQPGQTSQKARTEQQWSIQAGDLASQRMARKSLVMELPSKRGAQISQRQNQRLAMKRNKPHLTSLMSESHQEDPEEMMKVMTVKPKQGMKETWRQTLASLLDHKRRQSTSRLTMWMSPAFKLCGSSSRHGAAILGTSRRFPG